jgi:TRAP-type uncharacterized transport system substrate-binding protein
MGPHRQIRAVWKWLVPAVGVAALGLAAYVYFHTPRARTYRLTMTGGNAAGERHHLAEMFRAEAATRGVELDLRGTAGAEEALDQVNSRQLDCAFVSGGLSLADRPNVRQVATLHVEPLHLLVKKDLAGKVTERLTALEGRTVSVGELGSGTHTLAVAVLSFAGLKAQSGSKKGGYVPLHLGEDRLCVAPAAELPDAIFLLSSLPSHPVKHLVGQHGYRLVPLPFGEAFALEALGQDAGPAQAGHTIDKGRTHPAVIPAFTYGVGPPVPPQALPTLGNRLLLVAHKDVDRRAVEQLIEALYGSKLARISHPPLDAKLMSLPPEMPWHEGAELYRQHARPVVSGDVVNLAHKGTATLAAAASGLIVLWGWLLARRKARKARELRQVLNEVNRLDDEALSREEKGDTSADELLALRNQLTQLRASVLDRYTEGELDDNELLSCFLTQINNCRDNLTRLIAQHGRGPAPAPPAVVAPPPPAVVSAQRTGPPDKGRGKRDRRK